MARNPGQSLVYDLRRDLRLLLSYENRPVSPKNIIWALFACDAYAVLASFRIRKWAKKWKIPFVGRALRFLQTMLYSIELGIDIELGHGVYFVHTLGTVVGGDARIGEGCVFFGNNTIGGAREGGSAIIGRHCVIGAGARVIGKLEVGDDCYLGANAVVVDVIPAGKVAVGIPARVIADNPELETLERMKRTARETAAV